MTLATLQHRLPDWSINADGAARVVSNQAQLDAAISTLKVSGGTIQLDGSGGPYDLVVTNADPSSTLVFTALDENVRPEVTKIVVSGASNVAFEGLSITQSIEHTAIRVIEAESIALVNLKMSGTANGYLSEGGTATVGKDAMLLRFSENIVVADNNISQFSHGIQVMEITGLEVTNNEISLMQGDGLRGGGLQNAEISGNYMHDFYGSTQTLNHSDMIQLWSTHTTQLNKNIEITGNLLDSGTGAATQAIFIRHDQLDTGAVPGIGLFDNISITNNVIHNGFFHGITVNHTSNLEVTGNTVLWNPEAVTQETAGDEWVSRIPTISLRDSPGAVMENNIAGFFEITTDPDGQTYVVTTQTAGDGRSNFQLDYADSSAFNYADAHFVNLAGSGDTDARDLLLRDDSPLRGVVGAELSSNLTFDIADTGLSAVLAKRIVDSNSMAVELSAAFSRLDGTQIDPTTATVVWRFDDGTTASGIDVVQYYQTPGEHRVVMEITDAEGRMDSIERTIVIEDPVLLKLDFETGFSDGSNYGAQVAAMGRASAYITTDSGRAWDLSSQTKLAVDRFTEHLTDLDSFEINIGLQKNTATGTGEVLVMHGVMSLSVLSGGAVKFDLTTDTGTYSVTSGQGVLSTTDRHDLSVQFNGAEQTLSILLDGEVVAQGDASGHTTALLQQPLTLGSPWLQTLESRIDDLTISKLIPHLSSDAGSYAPQPSVESLFPQEEREALLNVDFADGGIDSSSHSSQITVHDHGQEVFVQGLDGEGFHLNGTSDFEIDASNAQLRNLDNFEFSFDFRKDEIDGTGVIMRQHTILDLQVVQDGMLLLKLNTDEGFYQITSGTGVLSDTEWHTIKIRFDDTSKELAIEVDGEVEALGRASGRTGDLPYWGIVMGNPWGESIEARVDNMLVTTDAYTTTNNEDEFNPIVPESTLGG